MHPERIVQMVERAQSHVLTGARPVSVADGVDTSTWRSGAYGPFSAQIYLDGNQAASVTQPTGGTAGVEVWALKTVNGSTQWYRIAVLNAGSPIPLVSDVLGESERLDFIGSFDRLFIAGTASAGAVTATFVPYEIVL
jgi:hypothetical protein